MRHVDRVPLARGYYLILLALVSLGARADLAPGLSIEELISLKQVRSAVLSPNGDQIAYLLQVPQTLFEDDDGSAWVELHVIDTQGQHRSAYSGKVKVNAVAWAADSRKVFFVTRSLGKDFADIYSLSPDDDYVAPIISAGTDIVAIFPSPDGSVIAFLAVLPQTSQQKWLASKGFRVIVYEESEPDTKVWLLDLSSGKLRVLDLPGSASDLAWAPDSRRLAVALAPTASADDAEIGRDVFLVDISDTGQQLALGIVGKLAGFAWSPDGSKIAYIAAEDQHDPNPGRLFAVSSKGGARSDLSAAYDGQVEDFHWLDNQRIAYLGSRGVWTEYSVTALQSNAISKDSQLAGPIVRSVDARPGQRFAAAVADTPEHPREVYLVQPEAEPRRLTHSNPLLSTRRLAGQRVIQFKARDGLDLEAVIMQPLSHTSTTVSPSIIFVHGGPEGHYSNGWVSSYDEPAQAMAAQGYLLAFPNYRGSTGRGVEFSKRNQHDLAGAEFNDLVDLRQHLLTAGLSRDGQVGIAGMSYGGYAAMWAATALTEYFDAAVAFVGVSNVLSMFGSTDIPREMKEVHSLAWPWEDWQDLLQRSPVYHAGKSRTPLLIMAGDSDERFDPSQSLEMYRHLKLRTETPMRLVMYPGEGHGLSHTAAQYDYALRFERWMNHYLLGPGGRPPAHPLNHGTQHSY
jgi:dipeptidyl aminopeptidase/acylaminoacyl peptidase